jgi:two-component system cell cycle response regulator
MSQPRSSRLTLGARLLWWQLIVLMPLLVAALLHHLYLMPNYTRPLQDIANRFTREVLMEKNLQLQLRMSAMPVNDYLLTGEHHEVEKFGSVTRQVDQDFSKLRAAYFNEKAEAELIDTAQTDWQRAERLAEEILAIAQPVAKTNLMAKLKRFDRHIDNAASMLEKLYVHEYRRVKAEQAVAQMAHKDMHFVTIGAFVVAILLSTLIGSALLHSIVTNLESMRRGASLVAAGELDKPVHADGIHEIEQLADTFNVMTRKLQAHDAALQELALHDGLTCLENRRMFDTRFNEEMLRAKRYRHPLSLLMLDIDHFKVVNDNYGHQAGDTVLRKLAETIKDIVRPADHVFRYGGEEFSVLAPETDTEGALALAERIRETVAATIFHVAADTVIHITISIGVTTGDEPTVTTEELIAQADKALYQAKASGRNRSCRHVPAATDTGLSRRTVY